jgi:hypothetical protein
MLHALLTILGLASVVLALLVMVQVVSLQDLLTFTKRGLVAIIVLLVVGCVLKSVLVAIITSLVPVASGSLVQSLLVVLAVVALFFVVRLLVVTAHSRHNP